MQQRSSEVDAYLQKLEPDRRLALEVLRALVFDTWPEAVEGSRYQIPSYDLGAGTFFFAAQKRHWACMSSRASSRLTDRNWAV